MIAGTQTLELAEKNYVQVMMCELSNSQEIPSPTQFWS